MGCGHGERDAASFVIEVSGRKLSMNLYTLFAGIILLVIFYSAMCWMEAEEKTKATGRRLGKGSTEETSWEISSCRRRQYLLVEVYVCERESCRERHG